MTKILFGALTKLAPLVSFHAKLVTSSRMFWPAVFLPAALLLIAVTGCGKAQTKGLNGRTLPAEGTDARLIEKHGWIAVNEQAMRELIAPPSSTLLKTPQDYAAAGTKEAIDRALEQKASRLIQSGQVFQVSPGTKLRILKYFGISLAPLSESGVAYYVQVEILDGSAKGKRGITTADGVE